MSIKSVTPSNHFIVCHPLLLLPQSLPASESFPMSWLFASGGQSIGASVLVFPMNIQDWFPLWLTGLISLQFKGLSHPYMTTGKAIALTIQTFVGKVMSLLFNILSRWVIAFLPRSKCLLVSWLQSLSTVFLEPQKITSVTVSTSSPSVCHEVMGLDAMILVFWMLSFKPAFSLSFPLHQETL